MSFKLSNYSKSTPKKWQMLGDLSLLMIPVLMTIVEQSPLSQEVQTNVVFWMGSALAVVKVLTQFFGKTNDGV